MWFDTIDTALILAVIAFSALVLLCTGLWQYLRQNAQRRDMVLKIKNGTQPQDNPESLAGGPVRAARGTRFFTVTGFLGLLGKKFSAIQPGGNTRLRAGFLKAGIRHAKAGEIYWGTKGFLALGLPIFFFMTRLAVFKVTSSPAAVIVTVLTALAGYYLPDLWLRIKIARRKDRLLKALPDALDLLVVCVEAGMGLDGAFQRVANEIGLKSPELSDELKLLNLELRAGKSRHDALRNLAERSDLDAMASLVTLMVQTDRFGTSMAASLRIFSESYRTQRYQKAEELAAKIPIKLIFPLILFIFPSLFVVILGPAAIRIWQNIIAN